MVSAIIPTYNYGKFVTEAVESALAQTYEPLEVIVVDDGSTDNTKQILEPYMSRIRYIYQKNQGLSAARNTGIAAARGEFIAFLDSDDLWHSRKTEVQVRYLQENPHVALAAGVAVPDLGHGWPEIHSDRMEATLVSFADVFLKTRFGPSSVIASKQVFCTVGNFSTELRSAEDRDMWIRVASQYQMARIDLPLWFYRIHGNSMSKNAAQMEINIRRMLKNAILTLPCLQAKPARSLVNKAWAFCDQECAIMYREAGQYKKCAARLVRSLLRHPLPLPEEESYKRVKMLVLLMGTPFTKTERL